MATNPTDPRVLERIRKLSGSERLRLQRTLVDMGHRLAEAGIRHAHPDWDDARVSAELRERVMQSQQHYSTPLQSSAAFTGHAQR